MPITNLTREHVTTLRPRVKAEATEEPIRIMGPSGPENRQADTVTMVPNNFTKTVLKIQASSKNGSRRGRGRGEAPEAEEVGHVDAVKVRNNLRNECDGQFTISKEDNYMIDAGAGSGRLYHNHHQAADHGQHQVPKHELGVQSVADVFGGAARKQ